MPHDTGLVGYMHTLAQSRARPSQPTRDDPLSVRRSWDVFASSAICRLAPSGGSLQESLKRYFFPVFAFVRLFYHACPCLSSPIYKFFASVFRNCSDFFLKTANEFRFELHHRYSDCSQFIPRLFIFGTYIFCTIQIRKVPLLLDINHYPAVWHSLQGAADRRDRPFYILPNHK